MLRELRIEKLGVIDEARLELAGGLTVLTGETGAGKTMVVTGLALLFGGRGDPGRIRSGATRLSVEGRLDLPADHPAWEIARRAGAEADEDGTLIVSRTVNTEGRSRAHMGGRSVPVAVLSELAESAWALHGQSDQLRLRRPTEQRAALDRFAGADHTSVLAAYHAEYARWRELGDRLAVKSARTQELARTAEVLRHGLAEIAAVGPQPGEEQELSAVAVRLGDAQALGSAAQQAYDALSGDPMTHGGGVQVDALSALARAALPLERSGDQTLHELGNRVAAVSYTVTDIAAELADYVQDAVADPARLAEVQERISALQAVIRRFAAPGAGSNGVLAWAQEAQRQLLDLDVSDDALAALREQRDAARRELGRLGEQISAARRLAGRRFSALVQHELGALAMPVARIEIDIRTDVDAPGPDGIDEVRLLLAAHAGTEAAALHRAASGGELSRVMLAIEVVLAGTDPVPLMVFDEVDAGVGGQAAVQIGRRLAALAAHHQVLVVTHLPQVAAHGSAHLVVDKTCDATITATGIRQVTGESRVQELSRMLAGLPDSETGLAHAAELLASAADPG
ncbi:MAG: DNA repair protein RecN [Geodermatophilaceae bacterium]|nr:DNA repair protein RecN [Geodermatophilaceae bacterium]